MDPHRHRDGIRTGHDGLRKRPTDSRCARAGGGSRATPPVATVDGTPISRTEYDIYVKSLLHGRPANELTTEQKNQVLDELINMQLLAGQGAKDGLEKDPDIAAQLDVVRMRVLADAESQKYLKDKEPTDAELHAEYDTAIAAMDKTEYHARHILVAPRKRPRPPSRSSRAAPSSKTSPRP